MDSSGVSIWYTPVLRKYDADSIYVETMKVTDCPDSNQNFFALYTVIKLSKLAPQNLAKIKPYPQIN